VGFAPLRATFYLATSSAIVAGGATLLGHGPPQGVTGACLAGYLGLLALGVTQPRSRIFGEVVACVPDGIALTFDDGPHPIYTRQTMDALEAGGARGTFFMIGRKMAEHPDLVREVVARGHAVGAHGYTHDRLYAMRGPGWLARDADAEEEVWDRVLGKLPVLYRPPIGLMNPRIARLRPNASAR
jgi:peptidoglycan/xylan/chitin deacetylase (PgdA/CDA1 family)